MWAFPLLGALLVAAWQWATVAANYGGNWTALFCTGALEPHPPLVDREHVYLFADSTGYDGQMYHYVAHDPFLRTSLQSYIDSPRMRYRRILLPLAAYFAAMGRSDSVDAAYLLVCLTAIAAGVYWSCRVAEQAGFAAAWGMLFLLIPAIPVTMDRLVVDGLLAALTAGFLCYLRSPSWKLLAVLACAALARETGLVLIAAYAAHLAWSRAFRSACIYAASALPAVAWYAYVQQHAAGTPYVSSFVPFSAIFRALAYPVAYPAATPLVSFIHLSDAFALAGMLLAFCFALYCFIRYPKDPVTIAALIFALLEMFLQRTDLWQNAYDFGRVFSPLLLCLTALAARRRNAWLVTPVLLIAPRIAIQLAPQALGIARHLR